MATCSPQSLLSEANCFLCLPEKQLMTIVAQLLCDITSGSPTLECENLEGADSPLNVVTPDFVGQTYLQSNGTVWQAGSLFSSSWTMICAPGDGLVWGPDADTLEFLLYETDDAFGPLEELTFNGLVTITNNLDLSNPTVTFLSFPDLVTVGGDISLANTSLATLEMPSIQTVGGSAAFSSVTSLQLDTLQSIGTDLDLSADTSILSFSAIALTSIGGRINLLSCSVLVAFSLPSLTTLGGDNNFNSMTALETLSFPSLTTAGGIECFTGSSLVNLDLTALVTGTFLNFPDCTSLTLLDLSALVTMTGDLVFSGCTVLVSVLVPNLVVPDGTTVNFNACALNATSVELILRRCVLAGVTTCTIILDGGTNAGLASLSAQGQADAAALTLAGNTVTLNP